ncbi:OmpA family protein [Psychroserpens algicola]|uniref:OmpA family protein n=1 Tax=Psychroserpens algicola TaxID=1719034 RepID=A0ABT0H8U4_9FLAO|nr:OmpA family protein [Psychroserpens algicola]MCK8480776.1 OmpA family protein [Psychroserpens algicola]
MHCKPSYAKLVAIVFAILIFCPQLHSQTKKLKRPKSRVGISSVDTFVGESFDLYDKVYKYDGYAQAGTPLDDDDIDVLEEALVEMTALSESAPEIISDLDGVGVLKQGKATLQINKAKKALKYSIKTAKELLLGERERKDNDDNESESSTTKDESSEDENDSTTDDSDDNQQPEDSKNISDDLEILSKYDFVPGDELIFFDDFSQDFIGDFPSKWNTNGSGETVKIKNENWLELKSGYGIFFIPDVNQLPEDYTIEFDILTSGISQQTSSTARLHIYLSDNSKFNAGSEHHVMTSLPFGQYSAFAIKNMNFFNRGGGDINSSIEADIRDEVLNQPHIAISVTKKRYRLWVNEVKYVDIPRFIEVPNVLNHIKFHINNFKDGKERIFIKNLKIAKGGVDLRRKLLAEGKISTNGILFNSGSATIQSQSYGIIRQISQVLQQDNTIKLKIVGHTDADGGDDTNMKLSKSRAEAVKQALITVYKIDASRLISEGKGESEPVADNTSEEGKAQNRRVEFIKQ